MAVEWFDEMTAALRSMRANGIPLYVCAEKIGVTYEQAVYKARELGIAQRMNRGRRRAEDVMRATGSAA